MVYRWRTKTRIAVMDHHQQGHRLRLFDMSVPSSFGFANFSLFLNLQNEYTLRGQELKNVGSVDTL